MTPRIALSDKSPDSWFALLGRRPELMEAWEGLEEALMGPSSTLPFSLKENVRRVLSRDVGCTYCASFADAEAPRDARESVAIGFCQLVISDYTDISDASFDVLREEFTEEQIVELLTWICFKFGGNVMARLMKFDPANEDQKAGYDAWMRERLENPTAEPLTRRASV